MYPSPAIPESISHLDNGHSHVDLPESECLAAASELRELLKEEADVLSRFAGTELLWLTPRKESLINEMGWKLNSLKCLEGEPLRISHALKEVLSDIDRLNRSNGVFIQRSLAHWEDFLTIFSPPSYGRGGDTPRPLVSQPRGRAFSREV
jgi:flagellar biosynthesis/type III secretory pathway chaperone